MRLDWVRELPEVGEPIRGKEWKIRQDRKWLRRLSREIKAEERELMREIRKLWSEEEIACAKATVRKTDNSETETHTDARDYDAAGPIPRS